ncbi:hypothetical protein DRQ53_09005 [bacterium]|nr:MAG: hypothetical protein DRQ53_09005 [bacterium]
MRVDSRARGLALLVLISAALGWLERRPPAWLEADPLSRPFGLAVGEDRLAGLDSILFPPPVPAPEPQIIDPNLASPEQWIALPGIGPVTAAHIETWLQSGRRFRRAEDLEQVHGIGPVRLDKLRPWLRFPVAPVDSSSVHGLAP